jgi:hypothetical protein
MFTELVQVRVNLDDYKKREDFLRQQIQQRMGTVVRRYLQQAVCHGSAVKTVWYLMWQPTARTA